MSSAELVALTWHQRTAPIDARERLVAALADAPDRAFLATCHRAELYLAVGTAASPDTLIGELQLAPEDRRAMRVLVGDAAAAHLFAVAAGLDSAVIGEPQILGQVRRASRLATHPLLVAVLGRALYVGRSLRRSAGLSSTRSVGSLAVDALLADLDRPQTSTVLVIGAGEMGKLALRALARRVGSVVVANRDIARASALAEVYGAEASGLDDVPEALGRAHGVISAADTRGAVLGADVLAARVRAGRLPVVDIAVPRSVDAHARAMLGDAYRSVDDLPNARSTIPEEQLREALASCADEARRFVARRSAERSRAIRELREDAERLRIAKLESALRHLGHLSERDRRIVVTFSSRLTSALLHGPTVALRESGSDGERRYR